jgi:enolase
VPSGASTGDFEANELRDGNEKRFGGKGVLKAIENIEKIIAPEIVGMSVLEQKEIDKKMLKIDGTENKSKLGANAILAVSMAVTRLGAIASELPLYKYIQKISGNENEIALPRPFFNIINGGLHAGNKIAFQEFMISPNLGGFQENYRAGAEIYQSLKKILKKEYGGASTLLGDEGGFAPDNFYSAEEALDKIMEAVSDAGYEGKVDIALDVAASEFYKNGKYNLGFKTEKNDIKTSEELIGYYLDLIEKYPIVSIEDPFDQGDFASFAALRALAKKSNVQIVADDLTVTNPERIKKAIENKSANALLLKINQIGSITESIEAFKLAKSDN